MAKKIIVVSVAILADEDAASSKVAEHIENVLDLSYYGDYEVLDADAIDEWIVDEWDAEK